MDATDHENIPSPDLGALYSNLIHSGFDYLNQDKHCNMRKLTEQQSGVSGSVSKTFKDPSKNCADISEKRKPFGWFHKNLFPEEQQYAKKPSVSDNQEFAHINENKNTLQSYKHSPHKKYVLSNFDLNALSPNSW